jgi:YD repeat-containing protein
VVSSTDGKSQKTSYTYDKADRITKILYAGTTTCSSTTTSSTYAYDADGHLTCRVMNMAPPATPGMPKATTPKRVVRHRSMPAAAIPA